MPAGHRGARAMKHPTELATAIEEAEQQARRAYELNDRSLPKTPQHCVGGGLFQHALDIADATIILVKKELPGPALALARPLIESWLRGVWAAKCAEDQEIKDFRAKGQPNPWKLPDLAEYVKERVPTEREYLEEVIEGREVRNMLHDLTHGGRLQVQYREGNPASCITSRRNLHTPCIPVIGTCCVCRVLLGVRDNANGVCPACVSPSPVVRKTHTRRTARITLHPRDGRALSQEIYATFGERDHRAKGAS